VIIGDHAKQRMKEREISDIEVYRILQTGHVMEEPSQTERKEWKCKLVRALKGNREAGVVTIILHSKMLFVQTVEWEDL
jgi:glucuronate isomerase